MLAIASLANILSYADTLLLSDSTAVEALGAGLPALVECVRQSQAKRRPQRFYAAAAIANAASHPRLASILLQHGGSTSLYIYVYRYLRCRLKYNNICVITLSRYDICRAASEQRDRATKHGEFIYCR